MHASVFDLHDEAYYRWRDAGIRDAVLVHVDSHADAAPWDASRPPDIGNYVRAAISEGIVSRVVWVVPDTMWRDAAKRRLVDAVLAEAEGLPIEAGPLETLPRIEAAVLLDLDVDFFFIAGHDDDATRVRLADPWIAPEDLAAALNARCASRLMTTIATSVTGCFTAMEWQHLGGVMAAALDRRAIDLAVVTGAAAERHPFRTPGHVYLPLGRVAEARACFESALALDAADPWARLGLAMLAADAGKMEEALAALPDRAPEPGSLEWWRTRGRALAQRGELAPAIEAYRQVLSRAVAGAVPLRLRMSNRDRRLVDPDHWRDHAAIASLYRRAGDAAAASAHERIARAAGIRSEERL